ncbi:unnamed protein product [Rhizoctonia solani]|uniref:Phosphatidylglycerophosphatase GEP4, mitochondrial n=1 Tax=Rhizoctonia solani TaxID=456999 RepID=A0A8H3AYW6_9AGAM|nr:unnamed protein product [Rhizoctonia solani]
MSNLHGSIFALRALLRPGLLVPAIRINTISRLDFAALKQAGYTGVVFDRDNCLTIPHRDTLDAWNRCKVTFGRENMLVVSNSAGTSDDPLGIQAESLACNLGVPVFRHRRKKPACGEEIIQYFRLKQAASIHKTPEPTPSSTQSEASPSPSLNDPLDLANVIAPISPKSETRVVVSPTTTTGPRLLVIGDRLFTDILLSTTLPSSNDHLPIWTTRLWKTPDLPVLRFIEQSILRLVLWHRNQTFRNGVIEQRARGETWLGKEGWLWWVRKRVLMAVQRGKPIPPGPVPSPANPLAKFILPLPAVVPWRPTTYLGWAWYYSKIFAKYTGKGSWIALVWAWVGARGAVTKSWSLGMKKIEEARARRTRKVVVAQPAEVKSS